MSPDQIGQLLVVGCHGTSMRDDGVRRTAAAIEAGLVSGVILFRYNIESRSQLVELSRSLRAVPAPQPLLIMVDQEGGRVQRLHAGNGFSDTPGAGSIVRTSSPAEAEAAYLRLGTMLGEAGVNMALGPCVDLDGSTPEAQCAVIGGLDRSYGAAPETVVAYGGAMVRGLRAQGRVSCLKHFPGHGRARGDTHVGLVDITATWSEEELEPYRALIRAGLADAVMTAHLVHRGIDPVNPATLSPVWTQRLRGLGFQGVIMADDLHMGAVASRCGSLREIVRRGFAAGLDLQLFSNNPLASKDAGIRQDGAAQAAGDPLAAIAVPDHDLPWKFQRIVAEGVAEGWLDPTRLEASCRRVVALKERIKPGTSG